jgi:threonine synthase
MFSFLGERPLFQDGGLYFPERIPILSSTVLESWRGHSYQETLQHILGLFISETELPSADLGRFGFDRLVLKDKHSAKKVDTEVNGSERGLLDRSTA